MHRSIAASPTALYSSGAGVLPKGNLRQRKTSSLTIAMHVDVVVALHVSRGRLHPGLFLPIRIRFFATCFVFLRSFVES